MLPIFDWDMTTKFWFPTFVTINLWLRIFVPRCTGLGVAADAVMPSWDGDNFDVKSKLVNTMSGFLPGILEKKHTRIPLVS